VTEDEALAAILRLTATEGDGVTLDGRDPERVVRAVEKAIGARRPSSARRKSRIKPVSDKRAARPRLRDVQVPDPKDRCPVEGADDMGFRRFVTQLYCVVDGRLPVGGADPCHFRCKRVNGDWVNVDGELHGNLFPLFRRHHNEQHSRGIKTWQRLHGVELAQVCRVIGVAYLAGCSPQLLSRAAVIAGGYQHIDVDAPELGGASAPCQR